MAISGLIVRGDKAIAQRLSTIAKRYDAGKHAALEAEAQIELTEMKARTPVDTWALHDSGRIEMAHSGNAAVAQFKFGGSGFTRPDGSPVDYALVVHEDLTVHHPRGQAKFISSVLNESRRSMPGRLAARLNVDKVAR